MINNTVAIVLGCSAFSSLVTIIATALTNRKKDKLGNQRQELENQKLLQDLTDRFDERLKAKEAEFKKEKTEIATQYGEMLLRSQADLSRWQKMLADERREREDQEEKYKITLKKKEDANAALQLRIEKLEEENTELKREFEEFKHSISNN